MPFWPHIPFSGCHLEMNHLSVMEVPHPISYCRLERGSLEDALLPLPHPLLLTFRNHLSDEWVQQKELKKATRVSSGGSCSLLVGGGSIPLHQGRECKVSLISEVTRFYLPRSEATFFRWASIGQHCHLNLTQLSFLHPPWLPLILPPLQQKTASACCSEVHLSPELVQAAS
jgi:hypothetical protein